mgnify:CR=1 FL=1
MTDTPSNQDRFTQLAREHGSHCATGNRRHTVGAGHDT